MGIAVGAGIVAEGEGVGLLCAVASDAVTWPPQPAESARLITPSRTISLWIF